MSLPAGLTLGRLDGWALDPARVHLNHGSFSGVTQATLARVEAARREVEANPMRFYTHGWAAAWEAAVAAAAHFLGADPAGLAFTANATTALDVALRVLPWRPGERMVITDHAYPALRANVTLRAARSGAVIEEVPVDLDASDDAVVAAVLAAADGAGGVVLDAIASPTGRRFPLDRLVPALRRSGVPVVVDAAHVPGQMPAAVDALGASAWLGNFHKWACAPKSIAALWLAEEHRGDVGPAVPSSSCDGAFPTNSSWQGTIDAGPLLVLPAVLADAEAFVGHADRNRALADAGCEQVANELDVPRAPVTSSMAALVLPESLWGRDPLQVQAAIADRLGVEVAIPRWRDRLLLRLSAHVYTAARDIDRLAAGIAAVTAALAAG